MQARFTHDPLNKAGPNLLSFFSGDLGVLHLLLRASGNLNLSKLCSSKQNKAVRT